MGLSKTLIVFPIIVLTICIIGAGGSLQSTQATTPFCVGTSSSLSCTVNTNTNSTATGVTYTCSGTFNCVMPYQCPTPLPAGTQCVGRFWIVTHGTSVVIPSSVMSGLTGTSGNFIFGPITSQGFVVMITTATVIVAIGALNFLGSGENSEGIHIAWMSALLLGMWIILSGAEGFIVGSPSSFFVQLDNNWPGLGTLSYTFLTLLYTMGVVGSVSRSSGAGGV